MIKRVYVTKKKNLVKLCTYNVTNLQHRFTGFTLNAVQYILSPNVFLKEVERWYYTLFFFLPHIENVASKWVSH